jgi:endonuclease I
MARLIMLWALIGAVAACDPSGDPVSQPQPPSDALTWDILERMSWPEPQETFASEAAAERAIWSGVYGNGGVELYCRTLFSAAQSAASEISGEKLSLEHVYPAATAATHFRLDGRSCVAGNADAERSQCRSAVADLRNLWPAYERLNQSHGTAPYGELEGEGTSDERWQGFCPDFERQYAREGQAVVEPTEAARGDIARTLLYMHFVYGLPLEPVIVDRELLLRWHIGDPVDTVETAREDAIEALQGNGRNPLVPRG